MVIARFVFHFQGISTHISHQFGIANGFNAETEPFTRIGDKYYYIEKNNTLNWFEATVKCHQMGGNLVNFQSSEDLKAISNELNSSELYWIDLTDLIEKNVFRSLTTGLSKSTHLMWDYGEPNNMNNNEHCAYIFFNVKLVINDSNCAGRFLFICESNAPVTVTIVNW